MPQKKNAWERGNAAQAHTTTKPKKYFASPGTDFVCQAYEALKAGYVNAVLSPLAYEDAMRRAARRAGL